nr:hypothetical protein [Tanacetum cinerariifolium]
GRSVHEVRAANFNHVLEFLRLALQRVAQLRDARNRGFNQDFVGRDVHGRRESVVRALALVHVVVGRQKLLLVAQQAAVQHMAAVGDYLIHVHIRLRARARLPHYQRKSIGELAGQNLVGHLANEVGLFGVEHTRVAVGEGGRFFQIREGLNNFFWHLIDILRNREVLDATLGLGAPVGVGGHLHLAHGVFFGPELAHSLAG